MSRSVAKDDVGSVGVVFFGSFVVQIGIGFLRSVGSFLPSGFGARQGCMEGAGAENGGDKMG